MYNWFDESQEFREAYEDANESLIDFAETALMKSIERGSDTATIFLLKTKGKHRGYVERVEQTAKDGGALHPEPLTIEIIDSRDKVDGKNTD